MVAVAAKGGGYYCYWCQRWWLLLLLCLPTRGGWCWILASKPTATARKLQQRNGNDLDYTWRGQAWVVEQQHGSDNDDDTFSLLPLPEDLLGARDTTWRWCCHFVTRHGLCPWAQGSVTTTHAVQLYFVRHCSSNDNLLAYLGRRFGTDPSVDPVTSIYFVIFLDDAMLHDFPHFHDWFIDYEEHVWDLHEHVTLAPFHPDWTYAANNDDDGDSDDDSHRSPLDVEKQAPYPTVSLVATAAIDRAGEEVTQRIADTNAGILLGTSLADWQQIYQDAVYNQNNNDEDNS